MIRELSIQETAKLLAVNAQTLRRWDASGRLKAHRKQTGKISRYFYYENDLENFLSADFRALKKIGRAWAYNKTPFAIPRRFYCPDKSIFKARLSRFEYDSSQDKHLVKIFSLIVAITGEIGNNSYDHNLGNWPDITGAFFGYNINEKKIILADRGQGFLKTLKQVRPDLASHSEALRVAFTEMISGRAPEARGNGLKFVREVVTKNNFKLYFQSGDAVLQLEKNNEALKIGKTRDFVQGAFAIINF